jgi:elongation factor G
VLLERMVREFGVKANIGNPQVAYKETIRESSVAEEKFVKQTGGRGQYAHVKIRIEPLERGKHFAFEDSTRQGIIPREFIPAIREGIVAAMENGVLVGFPVVDIKAILLDGSFHPVDSTTIAFRTASSIAFYKATKEASPSLLEPIMELEIVTPEQYTGDIMKDIQSRRAQVLGMRQRERYRIVDALVPLAEMFGYTTTLRSLSQGRATSSLQFKAYDFVPDDLQETILKKIRGF